MQRCKDCQRFYNVTVNAKKVRKHGRQPALLFTHEEFLEWSRRDEPKCTFCGISEADLPQVQLFSSIGLSVAALGIDRLDNQGDYTLDNIAFCCYACNKAKGNVFTEAEMRTEIGPAISRIWHTRFS